MKKIKKVISILLGMIMICTMSPFSIISSSENVENSERIIVSLGDSYSSGEGIEPFYDQEKSMSEKLKWNNYSLDWLAHRSELSWPGLLKLNGIGKMKDHRNTNWYFEAVSGAETKHMGASDVISENQIKEVAIVNENYEAELLNYEMPYQLHIFDKLNEEGKKEKIAYVTMTLSGNDVGFSDIVASAVAKSAGDNALDVVDQTSEITSLILTQRYSKINHTLCVNGLTEELEKSQNKFDNEVAENLKNIYNEIQEKAGVQAKIIVAGYPKLLNPNGSMFFTKEASKQIDKNVSILNQKIRSIVEERREKGLNIFFVSVEDNDFFGGHEAYTAEPYINGIMPLQEQELNHSFATLGNGDLKFNIPVSAYSIHPNTLGAQAYADAVQEKIDELENNCFVSGHIYKNSDKDSINGISPKVISIAAVDIDSGKKIISQPNKTDVLGTNETGGWNQLQTISYNDSVYFEFILPDGNYNLEITLSDGKNFTVSADRTDPSVPAEISAEKKELVRDIEIDLGEKCLLSDAQNYEWYLEPSIEAEDINVVDECARGTNYGWFIQSDYSLIKRDGCYGVISNQGEIVVSPKYTRASGELGNHFILYLKDSPYDYYSSDMFCTLTNSVTLNSVNYCENCDVLSTTFYGSGYYYDENRKLLLSADLMSHKENNEGYMLGQNAQGLVNVADTVIARKATFSTDHPDYTSNDTYIPELLFGIVKNNIPISKFIYDDATDFQDGIAALSLNGKWGYIDKDGQVLIPFEFDGDFVYEYSYETTRYNFDDETGETDSYNYITKEEKMAYLPSEGYIALNKGQNAGYYDIKGNEIVPIGTFAEARPVHNGLAWVKDKATGLWGVIQLPLTWQEIYKNKLNEFYNSDEYDNGYSFSGEGSMFELCDVDENGIPELFISRGVYGGAEVQVYTVSDNQLYELLCMGRNGEIKVNQEHAYIMPYYNHDAHITHFIYQLDNLKCEEIIKLDMDCFEDVSLIDDVAVSENEYNAQCKKYLNDIEWKDCGRKYNFDQIDEVL